MVEITMDSFIHTDYRILLINICLQTVSRRFFSNPPSIWLQTLSCRFLYNPPIGNLYDVNRYDCKCLTMVSRNSCILVL